VVEFIAGMITMGFVLAGLFFLKFWARSGDRLFVKFAVAFWLLAINEAMLAVQFPEADESWPYLLRLLAFALIAAAILQKNARRRSRAGSMPSRDVREHD
jgi:peptidoglycan/LPS O-acetylase OafA/YrhL